MTTNPNNPFVLPGLGQTGEMATNPLFASLEMMRQTFTTLAGKNGLANGLSMQATLDPVELEKKISELKSVESWLKLNLSMLSSTIQGMEVQLATITTLQQFMTANAVAPTTAPQTVPAPSAAAASPSISAQEQIPQAVNQSVNQAAVTAASTDAAQAWWSMLTQQFGQLAAATSATMGEATAKKTATKDAKASAKQSIRTSVKKTNICSDSSSKK